jgi:hypothetical protein
MIRGVLDRFEGETAVIEIEGETRDYPKGMLPHEAKPGDALVLEGEQFRLDPVSTERRKKEIQDLMDELFE